MTSEQKIVQYLNEAHAVEAALVQTLTAHIAMTPEGPYRDLLERHLDETRAQAERILGRLSELGEGRNPIQLVYGIAQTALGQVVAAGKFPIDLLRGSGGEEKLLKNARDEAASEALEIATYDSLEALAVAGGDEKTAVLAREHRTQEETFLAQLREQIGELTRAVHAAEVDGDASYDVAQTGAAQAARGVAGQAAGHRRQVQAAAMAAVADVQRTAMRAAGAALGATGGVVEVSRDIAEEAAEELVQEPARSSSRACRTSPRTSPRRPSASRAGRAGGAAHVGWRRREEARADEDARVLLVAVVGEQGHERVQARPPDRRLRRPAGPRRSSPSSGCSARPTCSASRSTSARAVPASRSSAASRSCARRRRASPSARARARTRRCRAGREPAPARRDVHLPSRVRRPQVAGPPADRRKMRPLLSRLTFANVTSVLALFVALGRDVVRRDHHHRQVGRRPARSQGRTSATEASARGTLAKGPPRRPPPCGPANRANRADRATARGRPAREAGSRGDAGTHGADGTRGETGARGEAGPRGEQGSKGDPCPPADLVCRGPQGATGPAGPDGPTGPTGAAGPTGPRGCGPLACRRSRRTVPSRTGRRSRPSTA
jgi:ferritin-like metal-binding protein YciE